MRTNIDIDDKLMRQAMKATGATTKKAAVEAHCANGATQKAGRHSRALRQGSTGKAIWTRCGRAAS